MSLSSLTAITHLLGLALAIGAATVKLVLLLKVRADAALAQPYLKVVKPVTLVLMIGFILVTLSGIGWMLQGYPFTPLMIVKLVLVGLIWILGPIIDKILEPKFARLAPAAGQAASPEFARALNQYLTVEVLADVIFYVIFVMWMLR